MTTIAKETAKRWCRQNLPHVNSNGHVRYQVELKPASTELGGISHSTQKLLEANDTSAAVGYGPFTPTERLVIDVEQFLNGPLFKK